ncbi:MAG: hypothetical protein AB9891_09430 [Anaerolineaceae bacterium]
MSENNLRKAAEPVPSQFRSYSGRRVRIGLIITLLGLILFLIGTRPSIFGLDRSPVIGFVQIAVMLVGLAIIDIGGFMSLMALWKDEPPSILADFGLRFVATGYVIAVFAGMADIFGLGSHPIFRPFFGDWQAFGVQIGQAFMGLGFLALIPYHKFFQKTPGSPRF